MSRRIRSAEESARREREAAKTATLTLAADSTAPRDPRHQGQHYRRHLANAHIVIGQLQERIRRMEEELAAARADREHILSRTVTITAAEEERRRAAAGMRERAASLMEWPPGCPTEASEDIRKLPDPKPKWSRA
ncbi:hypothetical protein LCM4573_00220 [Rhizobium sp. LCM 4573]|nr:hypothetical protein LCM4573_00220 [Rhizobium sp. LCM 4573]